MTDIFSKYKKHNLIKNTWLIAMSLVLAFGLNFMVQDTSLWQKIQVSVINSWENSKVWDLYLQKNNTNINLLSSKDMNQVKSLSLSITYNPANVLIENISSQIWWNLINQANEDWLNTLVINFLNPQDIKKWENILSILTSKKEEKLENLNIINANFTDLNNQVYLLSSSGVEF